MRKTSKRVSSRRRDKSAPLAGSLLVPDPSRLVEVRIIDGPPWAVDAFASFYPDQRMLIFTNAYNGNEFFMDARGFDFTPVEVYGPKAPKVKVVQATFDDVPPLVLSCNPDPRRI